MNRCLRISVTEKCNFSCPYCRSSRASGKKSELSFGDVCSAVDTLSGFGVTHIRLTGGEPLLRKNLHKLVSMLLDSRAERTVSLTTNGTFLEKQASQLRRAGVERINVHIDSFEQRIYTRLTRGGKVADAFRGLMAAKDAGIPVKLNCVLMKGINDDVRSYLKVSSALDVPVRFIELMPLGARGFFNEHFVSAKTSLAGLDAEPVGTDLGRGPSRYFKDKDSGVVFGMIAPVSSKFCDSCDRLRLTSGGMLKRCLADSEEIDLKDRALVERYLAGKDFDHKDFSGARGSSMREIGG